MRTHYWIAVTAYAKLVMLGFAFVFASFFAVNLYVFWVCVRRSWNMMPWKG